MLTSATITTPIYYVNDRPHIGHAYTTTISDVWARAQRGMGRDVFFLTGTDEHGVKVEKSAAARGISPQQLADENAAEFQRVMRTFALTNSDFIRTTEPRHIAQVQEFLRRLVARGAVYLGTFEGWYDEGQEEYHTENRARELNYKSPISGKPLVRATEQNYYFKLSAFSERIAQHYAANPTFVRPVERFNEMIGRMRDGLQDVPITRTNFSWGIAMPDAPGHVVYVWIDALLNYVTALGLGGGDASTQGREKYWPADYHIIGKEILWFHAVIWPALLMALDLPLPRCVYAHSFWIADGQKMSKSLGNFVDLPTIERYTSVYGLDAWRWYMATQGPIAATDADFNARHFHEVYTSSLVNTVGNCPSRVGAMIGKYFAGSLPTDADRGGQWPQKCSEVVDRWERSMERFDLVGASRCGIDLLGQVDAMINETEPFKLAKDPANTPRLSSILNQCAQVVRLAGVLLEPFIPQRGADLATAFGGSPGAATAWADRRRYGTIQDGTAIHKVALFPRVEATAMASSSGASPSTGSDQPRQ
ncbi:MAG: methionine--tRNA ligase [Phycisphaerales bacterium]|nr:methionine--tRNA ligase [Phycisphaerales bacterium]